MMTSRSSNEQGAWRDRSPAGDVARHSRGLRESALDIAGCDHSQFGYHNTYYGYDPGSVPGGLAGALFSNAQQRVLGILFGDPSRSFYANEIIALAQTGTGAVQRELARLAAAGLISVQRRGNQKHYRANTASPVFEELRGLIVRTFGIADALRTALAPLASRMRAAFIFGSIAKGTETTGSDIDLMVVSDTVSYGEIFEALEGASKSLGRTVNSTVYSRSEFDRRRRDGKVFVKRVLEQPKIWLIGSEHGLAA